MVHQPVEEEVLILQEAEVPFHQAVVAACQLIQVAVEPYLPVVVEVQGLQEAVEHHHQVVMVACNPEATEVHLTAHLILMTHQPSKEQMAVHPTPHHPTKARIQIPHSQAHQFLLFLLVYNLSN